MNPYLSDRRLAALAAHTSRQLALAARVRAVFAAAAGRRS